MRHMATGSKAPEALLSHDWLRARRRAAEGLQGVLGDNPTSTERVVETGDRGEGGDLTLVIDAAAEDAVFSELDGLHAAGARFTAVSEERGLVDYGDPRVPAGARPRRLQRPRRAPRYRPDRRLDERQARPHAPRPVGRGRRRPDDG